METREHEHTKHRIKGLQATLDSTVKSIYRLLRKAIFNFSMKSKLGRSTHVQDLLKKVTARSESVTRSNELVKMWHVLLGRRAWITFASVLKIVILCKVSLYLSPYRTKPDEISMNDKKIPEDMLW